MRETGNENVKEILDKVLNVKKSFFSGIIR